MRLLDRLVKNEWPGFNRKCRALRLNEAIEWALLDEYDIQVIKWWFARYPSGYKLVSMSELNTLAFKSTIFPSWIGFTKKPTVSYHT